MKRLIPKNFIAYAVFLGFSWLVFSLPALAAYNIEFGIPNLPANTPVSDPGVYISQFFIFGLGLVGFLAVAAIVVGGIMYMTGSAVGKVDRAKQIIWGAVTGLVLLLCSYLLLFIIDPTLVNLSPFKIIPTTMSTLPSATTCTNPGDVFDPTLNGGQGGCRSICPSGQQYSTTYTMCVPTCGSGITWDPIRGCNPATFVVCYDAGVPLGSYPTLAACQAACTPPPQTKYCQ